MGYYINPKDSTKERWLATYGELTIFPTFDSKSGKIPVCLVDNGAFTAAGICYCQEELDAFTEPDGRYKVWYLVPKDKILEVCPEVKRALI